MWSEFRAIADRPAYGIVKRFRNGMVHQRRAPSELHGETTVSYWDAGAPPTEQPAQERTLKGLSAEDHLALLLAAWEELIRPSVELGGRLLLPVDDDSVGR